MSFVTPAEGANLPVGPESRIGKAIPSVSRDSRRVWLRGPRLTTACVRRSPFCGASAKEVAGGRVLAGPAAFEGGFGGGGHDKALVAV